MKRPEPSFVVDVDVRNPGQFFACCGLLELAGRIWGGEPALAWFENKKFYVASRSQNADLPALINTLSDVEFDKGELECSEIFDSRNKPSNVRTIIPVILGPPINLRLAWWLDESARTKSKLKLWAGQQSSIRTIESLLAKVRSISTVDQQLLTLSAFGAMSFGFDPRSAWDALGTGFSPNNIGRMKVPTYPVVELLAAIGLTSFVPVHANSKFYYYTWRTPMPATLCRTLVNCKITKCQQLFSVSLVKRGEREAFRFAEPIIN